MSNKVIDITPLLRAAGIENSPLSIIETPGMYPYKAKVEENWAYYTAVGCKRFKELLGTEGKTIRDIGIVGICSGVEGIAVAKIFGGTLQRLIITDIDEEILEGTVVNLNRALVDQPTTVIPLVGSFCEPIEHAGYTVDFVHANVPNLPAEGDENLSQGAEKGTFLPPALYETYSPPQEYLSFALAAQWAYLQSARKVIPKGGSVITELGGRVPLDLVKKLFTDCKLAFSELIVGFKEQTEAKIDFEGYHRLEKEHGVAFEFYPYEQGKKLLTRNGIANPTWKVTGEEVKKLLAPHKVSAKQALELHKKGVAVGHTVHLFRGMKE
jgi:hypothetical protein